MTPSVSVIIPAYNVERYLPDAIQSVLSQTMQDWELVIADDCSSDRTLEIAKEFAERDQRIKVIRTDRQSGGPFIPRKKAVEAATSDLIAPFDADDRIAPDYLESLMEILCRNNVDAVFPVLHRWDGKDGFEVPEVTPQLMEKKIAGIKAVRYTLDGWHVHCGGGVIKKALYQKGFADLEDEEIIPFIDEMLSRIMLYYAGSVYFSYVPYLYRENPSSVTHSPIIKKLGFAVNPLIIEFIKNVYGKDSDEYRLAHRQNFHGIFDAMRIMNRRVYPKTAYYEEDKKIIRKCILAMDRNVIKSTVSWKYYTLSCLPYGLWKKALKYLDRIFNYS